jgi:hypothetical protein
LSGTLHEAACFSRSPARNLLAAQARNSWILKLDADERITRGDLEKLTALPDDPAVSGYFLAWNTHENGKVIEDYKLALFRRGIRYRGLIHENCQIDFRQRRLNAVWLEQAHLSHFPPEERAADKSRIYRKHLRCAIRREPDWFRYHWFLGYRLFREHALDEALPYLTAVAAAESRLFPVECLNSMMVLAELHARRGESAEVRRLLHAALAFQKSVAGDFEVRINFRLVPWLQEARERLEAGDLNAIRAYEFAC